MVAADRLVDLVWGEDPPRTATHSVQIYVSELRKAFDADGDVIVTRRPGYLLQAEPETIDARRFERLVGEAAAAMVDRNQASASAAADAALGLWGGSPLVDFSYDDFAQREIERLTELHHRAVATLCELHVFEGRPLEAVPMLRDAVQADPLREEPRRLLMMALFAGGRQAEALREFRDYRDTLGEETGLDPSPELLRLEEQILLRDPELAPHVGEAASGRTVERNPYKGLRAFGEADATDFFGRDELIERLRVASMSPLTAVVGPSGSGKSSAVRAGLIPALRKGAPSGSHDWTVITLMPGRYPFAEFDAAIARVSESAGEPSDPSDDGSVTRSILRSFPAESGLVLLVIDQFEELFTLTDENTRRAFLRNLVTAVDDPRGRIRVLLTVRADFYDQPLLYPEFAKLFTDNIVNVIPLTPAGIEAAAVEPAQRVGVGFAPNLLAELVSDMTNQPGALPLFQYTLTELFDERDNSTMTLDGYRRIGGLAGALSRRADAVYVSLDLDEQAMASDVFLRLVKPTEDRYTRRPVPVLDLESIGDAVAISTVLTRFGEERLLTFDRDSQTGAATVEVSHEALLGGWDRLSGWIEEARLDLAELDGLMTLATEWELMGRDPGYLLSGAKLTDCEAWNASAPMVLSPSTAAYLTASTKARHRAEERELERVAREAKSTRRARVRLWGLLAAVVALVAVVTFVILAAIANRPPLAVFGYRGPIGGWEEQMASGVEEASLDFGIEVDVVTGSDAGAGIAMQQMMETTRDLALVGWGPNYVGETEQLALDHPDTRFVLLDIAPDQEMIDAHPNVSFSVFADNEGAFLAGVIAALTTETGKIGFIGGVNTPVIWNFEIGFVSGARTVNPDIEILGDYLTTYPDYSGFQSAKLAELSARSMYESGVDVIFPAAGGSAVGAIYTAFQVTAETGIHRWAIGVDYDIYQDWTSLDPIPGTGELPPFVELIPANLLPHILSSVLKRTDVALYVALEDYANGTFESGRRLFDLSNDGIGYSTTGSHIDDIVDEIEAAKRLVIEGKIRVPTFEDVGIPEFALAP